MSKFFLLLVVITTINSIVIYGQNDYKLKGNVVDENNKPLAGASVYLNPAKIGTTTDYRGNYVIGHLSKDYYVITITYIGYNTLVDTIEIINDKTYNAQLTIAPINLHEVVVNANYIKTRKREESLNIEVIRDNFVKQNLGGSLMKSLENLPGITTIDIGSGQSKPVIRGLGFNRVVVVENSIKHEAQQWGADHGLEIDQYASNNIEIIKGPASLMYGSDAIGGVIDMKKLKLPANNTYGGTIDLTGKTNNDFLGTSIMLYCRKNWFFADFRTTLIDYGDYKVPTDSVDIYSYRAALSQNHLRNTAGYEKNFHISLGAILENFQSKFFVSMVNNKSGFFANAHGLEPRNVDVNLHDSSNRDIYYPYQTVNHLKVISSSQYDWEKLILEFDLGYQRNFRQEWSQYVNHGYMPAVFPDTLDFNADLERQFEKEVYSGNLNFSFYLNNKTEVDAGINSEKQVNRINGRGFIIPDYNQIGFGAFAYTKYKLSKSSLIHFGIRFDYGKINTYAYFDWFTSPVIENDDTTMRRIQRAGNINRSFSNMSWSLGYNLNLEKWSFKVNIGKGFRMPIAKELAANGVNYHHFSYEVGNSDLSPEVSYQLDGGIEYGRDVFTIGITPFLNYFSNYIYLNPGFEHDRLYGNGNQVYYYTQSRVLRYGSEIHAQYQLSESLQLGVVGEYVYSEQLSGNKKGFTLPFSPPASAIFNIRYQKRKIKFIENAYFTLEYKITTSQNNIVPPEEKTGGYRVINLKLGGDLNVYKQVFSISIQAQNLLNTKYFNHTSYYRLINVPEPGRNLVVNFLIQF